MSKELDAVDKNRALDVLFGPKGIRSSWYPQGFVFHDNSNDATFFALMQADGGPCGALASIQAYILKVLLRSRTFTESSDDRNEVRSSAFAKALASILWKVRKNTPSKREDDPAILIIEEAAQKWNYLEPRTEDEIIDNIKANYDKIVTGGLVPYTCSIILTKGIEELKKEMFNVNEPLVDENSECNQELVNLFLTGRAVSGVIDGDNYIEHLVYRGLNERSEFGFLTIDEFRGNIEVGRYYKDPIEPFWVLHSGNHYSVLYSAADDDQNKNQYRNDFYWFPGGCLCRYVRIELNTHSSGKPHGGERDTPKTQPTYSSDALKYESENIINCIQTRWTSAELIKWTQFDESSKRRGSENEKDHENDEDGEESSISEK